MDKLNFPEKKVVKTFFLFDSWGGAFMNEDPAGEGDWVHTEDFRELEEKYNAALELIKQLATKDLENTLKNFG